MRTRVTAAALSGLLVLALAGCTTPGPAEPTPTAGFSSEEEAFAAAEETYRAYVDALNQVDLSDPETFEAVYAWTTGELNASERKNLTTMSADGWSVDGPTVIVRIDPIAADSQFAEVELGACVDVSAVDLRDANGDSAVADERPPIQSVLVTVEESSVSPSGFLLADIVGYELEAPCVP